MINEKEAGVVVGRFQVPELHSAHRDFITEVESRHSRLIIFVGVHPFPSAKDNPLDFPTRAAMLRSEFPDAIVLPVYDHASDDVWSRTLDNMIRGVNPFGGAMLYGGRDSFVKHYTGIFDCTELHDSTNHSGTKDREAVRRSTLTTADERRGVIYACANRYPEVKPTVDIALVKREVKGGDQIFSVCIGRKDGEEGFRFPGGFVEPKHHRLEAAVQQELREEVGITCTVPDCYYVGSYRVDDWRTTDTECIMTSLFIVRYTDGAIRAGDDLHEVRWAQMSELSGFKKVSTHQPLFDMFEENFYNWMEAYKYVR